MNKDDIRPTPGRPGQPDFAEQDFSEPIVPIDFTPPTTARQRTRLRFGYMHGFIVVFLALAGAAAWFVLTARSVYVQAEPPTASIEVESGFALRLGQRYLMRPGAFNLRLSSEGYHDAQVSLEVSEAAAQVHPVTLQPLPGRVQIEVRGAEDLLEGARIVLGDADLGTSPLPEVELEPGEYEMLVTHERYLPYRQTVTVEGRARQQSFSAELSPAWATLSFDSEPPGADVIVDGELQGTTPLQTQLLQGSHQVTLKLAAHKAWQDELVVAAGQDQAVPPVRLERADGLVFIRSQPGTANVTINGDYRGQTPLEVALPPGVEHEITLFRSGYATARRTVSTRPDEERDLTINLEPVTQMVRIQANPADAELYIDGEYRGQADQTVELLAASQRVEIRKPGFVPYATTFTSRPGLEQQIRVDLKTLEQARLESIEPEIRTVAGQTLKLFYPTPFTMGASRREPGRRANEVLREVVLEKPFYLSLHEVSNGQYRRFRQGHASGTLQGQTLDLDTQPVVNVTWTDAALYCNWLSEQEDLQPFYQVEEDQVTGFDPEANGYRLPSEAEWEWAARTDAEGNVLRFPWGEELAPPERSGNFADRSASTFLNQYLNNYEDGFPGTAPVGQFTPNQKGLYDMAGNVSEWVHDYYGVTGGLGGGAAEVDPLGPPEGRFWTVKGSSWVHSSRTELRLSYRDFSEEGRNDLGFRIARYLGD